MTFWTAAGVMTMLLVASFGWLLANERRQGRYMTFDKFAELQRERDEQMMREIALRLDGYMTFRQHNELCERREQQWSLELAKLLTKLDEREKYALRYRETMQREIRELALDIVAIQTELHLRRRRRIAPQEDTPLPDTPTS